MSSKLQSHVFVKNPLVPNIYIKINKISNRVFYKLKKKNTGLNRQKVHCANEIQISKLKYEMRIQKKITFLTTQQNFIY